MRCARQRELRQQEAAQGVPEEGFRHLVAEMGVGQIVYGTDNPFNWPVKVDLVLDAPFLNNTEKEAILSGNLMKLLKIST